MSTSPPPSRRTLSTVTKLGLLPVLAYCFSLLGSNSSNWQFKVIAKLVFSPAAMDKGNRQDPLASIPDTEDKQKEIFIIGAGLPRSGTDSLRTALDRLGYKTYHAKLMMREKHFAWRYLFEADYNDSVTSTEYNNVVESVLKSGYNATVDFPTCLIFDQFLERFPNAKVILTVRDSPEQWAKSFRGTVGSLHAKVLRPPFSYYLTDKTSHFVEFFDKKLWNEVEYEKTGGHFPTIDSLSRAYVKWVDHVRQSMVENHNQTTFLEFNVRQGWEPLCTYLGIEDDECPVDTPFPFVNDSQEWKLAIKGLCFMADYWIHMLVLMLLIGTTCLIKLASTVLAFIRG